MADAAGYLLSICGSVLIGFAAGAGFAIGFGFARVRTTTLPAFPWGSAGGDKQPSSIVHASRDRT